MVAVETKKLTANLLATWQEIVNPGMSYGITLSREILVLEKTPAHRSSQCLCERPRDTVEIFLSRREFCRVKGLCGSCGELVGKLWTECA
jgi:hypothetical protein